MEEQLTQKCENTKQGLYKVMDMFCESCFKDGIENVPAVVFCTDCVTFFCKTCLRYHTKFLPDHVQQIHDMPKDYCQENCKNHKSELIKFYCKKCDSFACTTCTTDNHKGCESLTYVPTLLSEFEERSEQENFEEKMLALEENLQESKSVIKNRYDRMENTKSETKSILREYKETNQKLFDDLEREVYCKIDKISSEDKTNLAKNNTKLAELEIKFQAIKSEYEKIKKTSQRCKLFMMVKTSNKEIKHIQEKIEKLNNETEIHEINYEPANIIKTTNNLGTLKIERSGQTQISEHFPENMKQTERKQKTIYNTGAWLMAIVTVVIPVSAAILYGNYIYGRTDLEHVSKLKTRRASVTEEEPILLSKAHINTKIRNTDLINLSKIFHLYGNYLVSIDRSNKLLLLISTAEKKIVSTFALKAEPRDVTKVNENQVAVTFDGPFKIMFVKINNIRHSGTVSWSVVKTMASKSSTYPTRYVVYCNEKFFISSGNKIIIFDVNRNKSKTIFLKETDYVYDFEYLTLGKRAESLDIISYRFNNSLKFIHVAPDKDYETSYMHEDLTTPTGIAADDKGNVYVCGYESNNIHVLFGDLTKGKVLLNESDGIEFPWTITFSDEENKLFIYSLWSDFISVFRFV
ncbi:uncharacterized protein LOC123546190 [Mercenaria mercenaria]|uniref:uncharacterized protein LOC123546190 n=1 Tax=Mercenaria mercenaria TaxID=6596 RepID=UPI00234F382D|nr:uncharacterized protein LOC123546190 [Mercenaria mercenaria]